MSKFIGGILCGGYGKRLRPLTNITPKPLITIKNDYTILDKQLLQFKYAGINKVFLLAGYLHEKIQERYQDEWNGIKIEYTIEDKPRGTLYAINCLLDSVDKDVIVRNGDIVTDVNIREMITNWKKDTVSMFITPLVSPFGIVELSEEKIILFREKPKLPYYINGGIYVISTKVFDLFKQHEEGDVERIVFPNIAKKGLLHYYKEDDVFWMSVDNQKDLKVVRDEYRNKVDKPWGYEKLIVLTKKYMTKILYIMKGFQTSFHYHSKKDETLHILKGEGFVKFKDREISIEKNNTIRIKPNISHSIHATENLLLNEYSTPHPNDSIRIKDPYKR